jgi:hypothetical protein
LNTINISDNVGKIINPSSRPEETRIIKTIFNDLFKKETDYLESINQKKSIFKGCNADKELAWYDGILPNRLDGFCENLFDLSIKFHL